MRQGCKKLGQTVKGLNGSATTSNTQAITFEKPVYRPSKCADKFNKMYYPSNSVCKHRDNRKPMRSMCRERSDWTLSLFAIEEAIRKTGTPQNSKALGCDEIAPIMLKNMGELALEYIIHMFNLSLRTSTIPGLWKKVRVIPLLKPGKDPRHCKSYRPVSMLSPLAKAVETVLLPHLQMHTTLANHQHGFRLDDPPQQHCAT